MPWKWSAPLVQIWQILNITPFSLHFFNPHEPDATLMNKKGKKKHCLRLQVTMMENVMVIIKLLHRKCIFIAIVQNSPYYGLQQPALTKSVLLMPWYSVVLNDNCCISMYHGSPKYCEEYSDVTIVMSKNNVFCVECFDQTFSLASHLTIEQLQRFSIFLYLF